MLELKKTASTPMFVPDYTAASLVDVDFHALKKLGVRYIAFDADSTLVKYRGRRMSWQTKVHLLEKKHLFKGYCIASNRITNDLQPLAASIEADIVPSNLLVRKPKQRYFQRVIDHFGAKHPNEIAMIGDKLIADMWGGNRAGFVTVWVERLGRDGLHDRAFRVRTWERMMMNKYLGADPE
jgi:uncharacterized protein